MSRQIALFIVVTFIVWLFFRDQKLRPMTSVALWIPLLWVIIIGTRPVSLWFADAGLAAETLDDYLVGSPFDRNIFICLIIAGLAVLIARRRMLSDIFSKNRLFFVFVIFCGISCLWSDYAFTSFKRYLKDIGNVIMAIIIMTEIKPEQALKAILARYAYLAVTLSVLFIKYIPEFGRYYSRWTYEVACCGIATNNNGLGQVVFICGTFLIWDFIATWTKDNGAPDKLDLYMRGILLALVIWLLYMAHSATATVCLVLSIFILFSFRSSFGKKQIRNLGTWTLVILFFIAVFLSIPGFLSSFVEILGRDATLTGRTDVWRVLLAQPLNPLLGAGYQCFWQLSATAKLFENYYFISNQAHNGYLEVYLQTGLISLLLLIGAIIHSGNKLKKGLLLGNDHAMLLFTFFISILLYNWTEAAINKINILWFILIIALLYYPKASSTKFENDNANLVNNKIAS